MIDQLSLDKIKTAYYRKGFITLEDIEIIFGVTNRSYAVNIMKNLISGGHLEKIAESSYPVKYSYLDLEKAEVIDVTIL